MYKLLSYIIKYIIVRDYDFLTNTSIPILAFHSKEKQPSVLLSVLEQVLRQEHGSVTSILPFYEIVRDRRTIRPTDWHEGSEVSPQITIRSINENPLHIFDNVANCQTILSVLTLIIIIFLQGNARKRIWGREGVGGGGGRREEEEERRGKGR